MFVAVGIRPGEQGPKDTYAQAKKENQSSHRCFIVFPPTVLQQRPRATGVIDKRGGFPGSVPGGC
jgi:hypothetical protein